MPIAIIGSLIVFQALLIFVHLAVYATMAAAFGIGSIYMQWVFIVLAVSFIITSALSHFFKGKIVDWSYAFSAYWFGLVHFLFGGALLFYVTLNLFYSRGVSISPGLVGGIYFGAFFLIHLYGTWNSWRAEIIKVSVPISDKPGFDAAFWKDKAIAFVTDVHLGNVRQEKFLRRVVKKINAEKPEAVFIGGDIFDGVACDEPRLVAPLRDFAAPNGTYFVTGNHEFYLPDVERALTAIRATGTRVLHNEKITIGGIDFLGVDYRSANKPEILKKTLAMIGIDHAKPSVLIKHEPNDLDIAEQMGVSAAFFGHTHRGQIWPLSMFTRQLYRGYDYGLKPLGRMQVYTSSGVGTWGPPLRIGTKSEIVIVKFI